jgi:uncharacterized protein (TIGR03790 family)
VRFTFPIIVTLALALSARALRPDEIALVVNKNVADGKALAAEYAKARGIPDGRIIELDLPVADEISFQQYETNVVPAVREFLAKNNLARSARCLVTFYGVPLRITARENSPQDNAEIADLQRELRTVSVQIEKIVLDLEQFASRLDPRFRAPRGSDIATVMRRIEVARQFIAQHLSRMTDARARETSLAQVNQIAQKLLTPSTQPATSSATQSTTQPTTHLTQALADEMAAIEAHRYEPAARARLREIARQITGPLPYARLLDTQLGYLLAEDSQAAFDSELALVQWSLYARAKWQINPLYYRVTERTPPVMMVSRLDAQTPDTVRKMMAASIETEQHGLQGQVLVDSWAKNTKRPDGQDDDYTRFDKSMLEFAALVRDKTKLQLTLDDKPELVAPGSVRDIALYCGWYSPNEFVSPGTFVRGAIGVHIASYTLTTLHAPGSGDWVRQLLNQGVVASFGAVSEPYLHAFPNPDDFFPLILSGKVTLAEAFWKTNPLTSWRVILIGDPLYTPYKQNPAIAVPDLPTNLRGMFSDAATQPNAAQAPAADNR